MTTTIRSRFSVRYEYPVVFTRNAFDVGNSVLADILQTTGRRNRILVVIDANLLASNSSLISAIDSYASRYRSCMEIAGSPFIMTGGEDCKRGSAEVEKLHALINAYHLCRHSFVTVIGGGAVIDAAGYAAATAHRGLRLLRFPTTTLAQNDAGIGVKNAINLFGRKNFCGTFAPPFAVINDFDFLKSLSARDLRSGIAEAVKVALIKDKAFFDFLYDKRTELRDFEPEAMQRMIIRCAELHLEHIQNNGDPFECGSSRPLDFGHWAAHKIEELAGEDIRHGEAVAVGIALDSLYSFHKGMITELEYHKIFSLLETIGFQLFHPALGKMDIPAALSEFQEHLGGRLTIPLINRIGSLQEANDIDAELLNHCIRQLSGKVGHREVNDNSKRWHNGSSLPPLILYGSGKKPGI